MKIILNLVKKIVNSEHQLQSDRQKYLEYIIYALHNFTSYLSNRQLYKGQNY
jgi:hypothetical protein